MKASQRQAGAVLSVDFKPEQHVPSGFVVVLPLVTKERQSAMVNTKLEQSTDGAGAPWDDGAPSTPHMATTHTMSTETNNFAAIDLCVRVERKKM